MGLGFRGLGFRVGDYIGTTTGIHSLPFSAPHCLHQSELNIGGMVTLGIYGSVSEFFRADRFRV